MKEKFRTQDWLPSNSNSNPSASSRPEGVLLANPNLSESNRPDSVSTEINLVISRIEAEAIDIAPNYADWRDLGFALADALGESGRNYYQRLDRKSVV